MQAEQAIFTSLARAGRSGYHVVSRSSGVSEADSRTFAAWSPSHGALIVDEWNRSSLNVFPLGAGRYAISRTCEGTPEYSGRGGRQLYTHALLFGDDLLIAAEYQPVNIYRSAMALGRLRHQPDPPANLPPVELPRLYPEIGHRWWRDRLNELGIDDITSLTSSLSTRERVQYRHAGDRIQLAECLFGLLPRDMVGCVSLSTSLIPSPSRPFRINLLP